MKPMTRKRRRHWLRQQQRNRKRNLGVDPSAGPDDSVFAIIGLDTNTHRANMMEVVPSYVTLLSEAYESGQVSLSVGYQAGKTWAQRIALAARISANKCQQYDKTA